MAESLIYAKRVNALNGEPGGGKTWVALQACAEAIAAGRHVMFIDLEDHPDSTVARLRAMGATVEDIGERFHYIKPDRPMSPEAMEYLEGKIGEYVVGLVVIDSVGELLSLQGVKPNDDDAVAAIYRAIPRRLAALGPAVLLIDHVPKNNTDTPLYAIGSQRKKAAIDGASFMVQTSVPFAAGSPGTLKLVTAKDRLGNFVTGQAAALVNVTSSSDGDEIDFEVIEPELTASGAQRQTANMEKISRFLEGQPGRQGNRSEILNGAGVRAEYLNKVLSQMEEEGTIRSENMGQGKARRITLVREFRDGIQPGLEADDDEKF